MKIKAIELSVVFFAVMLTGCVPKKVDKKEIQALLQETIAEGYISSAKTLCVIDKRLNHTGIRYDQASDTLFYYDNAYYDSSKDYAKKYLNDLVEIGLIEPIEDNRPFQFKVSRMGKSFFVNKADWDGNRFDFCTGRYALKNVEAISPVYQNAKNEYFVEVKFTTILRDYAAWLNSAPMRPLLTTINGVNATPLYMLIYINDDDTFVIAPNSTSITPRKLPI